MSVGNVLAACVFVGCFLVICALGSANEKNAALQKKVVMCESLVLRCISDQGDGYTVMLGREQIASFMCFPINTVNVTK
jgi:hypothetical protein